MPKRHDPNRLYSASQAAIYVGMSHAGMRKLLEKGRVKAEKVGQGWVIRESALDVYLSKPRAGRGRPKQTLSQLRARRRSAA